MKVHSRDALNEKHVTFVEHFSRETGDFKTLSTTDIRVIALGVYLAHERGELERLKTEPKPLAEFRPKRFKADYDKMDANMGEDSSDEEQEETQVSE
jgi:hypothetical protein